MSKLFESKKKIIELVKEKPMTMTQISEKLDLGQSTTNQHIKELLRIGAIKEIENPYSRKWKYYEYNKGFEKRLEDSGYNVAKVRAFAVGILAIIAIAVIGIFLFNSRAPVYPGANYSTVPPSFNSQYSNSSAQGNFVVQLTDPPLVPPGTSSLMIRYSSVGLFYANSSTFEYFNTSGTSDLLNLTNVTKTIAILNVKNYSKIKDLRLNITSANITIDNTTYNVNVPQGYVEAQLNSSSNSSIGGALINMNPTIVRIYSQNNESIFVMVPNVKAIFIGRSEAASARSIGYVERINPGIIRRIRSNSSIMITNATLISSGNSTMMSIGVKNTGNTTVNLTNMQLNGFMEEVRLGYQGYSPTINANSNEGGSVNACVGIMCISRSTVSISANSESKNQSELETSAAGSFVNKFNNYLNFIVLNNGTLSLPIFNYVPNCEVSHDNGIGAFIGCRTFTGLSVKPGASADLHFNSTLGIGMLPHATDSLPFFRGVTKILLIPGQNYSIKVIGIGQQHSGIANANYTASDQGSISNYTSKLVGVSIVNEQVLAGNLSYNVSLQGFTSTINGTANYTLPLLSGSYDNYYSGYTLKNISILTPGFTLLGTTYIMEYIPGKCPVCSSGSIHCFVCIAGQNIKAAVLTIKSPGYQYYGPLSIKTVYSVSYNTPERQNSSINNAGNSTITTVTTMPQNQTGLGMIQGHVSIGPLCPVQSINNTCIGSIDLNTLYSSLKLELTSMNNAYNYTIPISANGTYSEQVDAGSYSVSMLNCHYIGCTRIIPRSVNISAGETTELNISINTGIA